MKIRKRIHVYGIVQGVGFRPFISRIANKNHIKGSVCNKGPYVEIFAEGIDKQINSFLEDLKSEAPERSSILGIDIESEPLKNEKEFKIIHSEKVKGDIFVSPDIATCNKCKEELYDKNNPRYLHPFINCTACGPRLTILDSMPYDRERTSMGEFKMCSLCENEYTDPKTRRYHAQPVCCNNCGPSLYAINTDLKGNDALLETRKVIREGGIAAIKGIGGFHLCCDATNPVPVRKLRVLKNRPFKPFAVMAKNIETLKRECFINEAQKELAEGPVKPILILEKRNGKIVPEVAPDNPYLGIMLPYTPVHMLLFDYPGDEPLSDCLIMTSANPKGAPICRTDEDALDALFKMCDIILSNNRIIKLRADDSVASWYKENPYMIRRSRGYAPLPFKIKGNFHNKKVLAIGGELKNTFCITSGGLIYPSPYVGDLTDLRSVKALTSGIKRMEELLEVIPETIVTDLHPGYNSVSIGKELAKKDNIKLLQIQHHYAHILSCMSENNFTEEPVIGVAFDGTGYGEDGTIWGGEILLASVNGYERKGSISPFIQAGGDLAAKEGWRIASALLIDAFGDEAINIFKKLEFVELNDFNIQKTMVENHFNSVLSTSAGRLFDGVSALLGLKKASSCEGEASMVLQFAAERYKKSNGVSGIKMEKPLIKNSNEKVFHMNTNSLFKTITELMINGEAPERLSLFFHEALADMTVAACINVRKDENVNTVALSGGVMQNLLLLNLLEEKLKKEGFNVLIHSLSPPNDGGLGLGQALYGLYN